MPTRLMFEAIVQYPDQQVARRANLTQDPITNRIAKTQEPAVRHTRKVTQQCVETAEPAPNPKNPILALDAIAPTS